DHEQPAPHGIVAVEIATGQQKWQIDKHTFVETDGQTLRALSYNPIQSTAISHCFSLSSGLLTSSAIKPTSALAGWKKTQAYTEQSEYYVKLAQFVWKIVAKNPTKAINYGEIDTKLLFFQYFYETNAFTLSRSILVADTTKSVLWHETIESDVDSDAFGACLFNQHCIV
ncbi:MAG: hypothetical protein ACK4GN_19150, partial [Runella sp.]